MGSGLSAKRLLGGSRTSLDSCRLLGLTKRKCRKVKKKATKIKRQLKRRPRSL